MALAHMWEALGSNHPLLTAVLDELTVGIALFDEAGRLLLHNSSLAQSMGIVPTSVQDVSFLLPDGRELGRDATPLACALRGDPVTRQELLVPRSEGARPVSVTALSVRDVYGDVAGGVLIVSPHPRGAEQVQREILGVVAHDLRNPLTAIRMTAQMLAKSEDIPPARRVTMAKRVVTSSGRIDSIVRTLIDYARSGSGVLVLLERESVDLGELCRCAIEEQETAFPGRKVSFATLGALDGRWDPVRLEQVVANLLSNALRHGAEGAPVAVTVDGSAATDVRLTVSNVGSPIPDELLPRLFEPFTVGTRSQDMPRRSIGLGLFIVRELVAAHSGKVTVHSSTAEGTTFVVILPRDVTAG